MLQGLSNKSRRGVSWAIIPDLTDFHFGPTALDSITPQITRVGGGESGGAAQNEPDGVSARYGRGFVGPTMLPRPARLRAVIIGLVAILAFISEAQARRGGLLGLFRTLKPEVTMRGASLQVVRPRE